jgi:hypothetical protein
LLVWRHKWIGLVIDELIVKISENRSNFILAKCRVERVDDQDELDFGVCYVAEAAGKKIDKQQSDKVSEALKGGIIKRKEGMIRGRILMAGLRD